MTEETSPPLNFDDIEEFSNSVESYAKNNNLPYLSALAVYAEEQGIEMEEAPQWISNRLKAEIMDECSSENMFEKSFGKLPI